MKKVKVEINDYTYDCADGCCTDFGTEVIVNDVELDLNNQDVGTTVKRILEHLGYEVELIETYKHN